MNKEKLDEIINEWTKNFVIYHNNYMDSKGKLTIYKFALIVSYASYMITNLSSVKTYTDKIRLICDEIDEIWKI